MDLSTRRYCSLAMFAFVLLILFIVYSVEYMNDLMPCPLCMLQRVAIVGVGVFALLSMLHNPEGFGRWVYVFFLALFVIAGLAAAGRQLWLQSLPIEMRPATCGVDIYYLLQMLPFDKAMTQILQGSAECAQVEWSFLGLGMAAWSLLSFVVLAIGTILQCLPEKRRHI